ncbi:MAG TPA: hypothetical protein VD861_15695 [Pyrinomonadaceae bacterium]|nr:hypothetical protein [Pyrinomonadaceae bacterium]
MAPEKSSSSYWWSLCLVTALLCLPVLLVTYHPLVDYPNHLARSFIFYNYESVPAFQATYVRLLEPIPDLGIELVTSPLLPFVGLLTASKIFLLLMVLVFVTGCHRLGRAIHGHPTWLAVPCCFFVYNSMLLYGMVNYVFGVGLFGIALSYWLDWRARWTAPRFLLVAILVLCAYLTHLTSYGFLGVTFVVITSLDYFKRRESLYRAALGLLPLVPPFVAFLLFMRGSGKVGEISWNTLGGKLIGALALILSYNYQLDAFSLLCLVVMAAVVVSLHRRRPINIAWPTFIAGCVLAFLYLICPKVLFTSSAADVRFIVPAALLLVLSLRLDLPAAAGRVLLLAWVIVASVRVGAIGMTWRALDKRIGAEVERLRVVPEGAKVYPVFPEPDDKAERSFEHVVLYTTVNQRAVVPTLFGFGGVSIYFRARPTYIAASSREPERLVETLAGYDYVWSFKEGEQWRRTFQGMSTPVYEADGFTLWRIKR